MRKNLTYMSKLKIELFTIRKTKMWRLNTGKVQRLIIFLLLILLGCQILAFTLPYWIVIQDNEKKCYLSIPNYLYNFKIKKQKYCLIVFLSDLQHLSEFGQYVLKDTRNLKIWVEIYALVCWIIKIIYCQKVNNIKSNCFFY